MKQRNSNRTFLSVAIGGLASEDAQYKKRTADLRLEQKKERQYLFAQAPEVKQAWEAFAAANQAKAQTKPAAGKK